jgi:hypothetical protein
MAKLGSHPQIKGDLKMSICPYCHRFVYEPAKPVTRLSPHFVPDPTQIAMAKAKDAFIVVIEAGYNNAPVALWNSYIMQTGILLANVGGYFPIGGRDDQAQDMYYWVKNASMDLVKLYTGPDLKIY